MVVSLESVGNMWDTGRFKFFILQSWQSWVSYFEAIFRAQNYGGGDAVLQKTVFDTHPFQKGLQIGVPQNGWFIMENPIRMDDLGVFPYFWKHPIIQPFFSALPSPWPSMPSMPAKHPPVTWNVVVFWRRLGTSGSSTLLSHTVQCGEITDADLGQQGRRAFGQCEKVEWNFWARFFFKGKTNPLADVAGGFHFYWKKICDFPFRFYSDLVNDLVTMQNLRKGKIIDMPGKDEVPFLTQPPKSGGF